MDGWKLFNVGGTSPEEYLLNGIMMPNENILMTGNQGSGDTVYFCMLMVKPDGTPDNNFAPNGIFKHIFGVNNNNSSSALALSDDGKIYLGGYTRTCANGTCGPLSSGIARYTGGQTPNTISSTNEKPKTLLLFPTVVTENQWMQINGGKIAAGSVHIFDLQGRTVGFDFEQNRVKLKHVKPGCYLIKIDDGAFHQTTKVVQYE
jgi:hypothetical protein